MIEMRIIVTNRTPNVRRRRLARKTKGQCLQGGAKLLEQFSSCQGTDWSILAKEKEISKGDRRSWHPGLKLLNLLTKKLSGEI
jgi:hypothetical protein